MMISVRRRMTSITNLSWRTILFILAIVGTQRMMSTNRGRKELLTAHFPRQPIPRMNAPQFSIICQYIPSVYGSLTGWSKSACRHHKKDEEFIFFGSKNNMLVAVANHAASAGRRAFTRTVATVGSQIPSVELHSWVWSWCLKIYHHVQPCDTAQDASWIMHTLNSASGSFGS